MSRWEAEKKVALEAVRRACRLVQDVLVTNSCSNQVFMKSDSSPVTVADFAVQLLMSVMLKEAFPEIPIFAEETSELLWSSSGENDLLEEVWRVVCRRFRAEAMNMDEIAESPMKLLEVMSDGGDDDKLSSECWWVIDPIDGTKGFLRGGQYAICLALVEKGEPCLGVLGCPNLPVDKNFDDVKKKKDLGVIFYAAKGEGAYQQALDDEKNELKIRMNVVENVVDARFCQSVETGHSAFETQEKIASVLGITKPPIKLDSQVKYALLACGESDIYLRLPINPNYHEKTWDHAAGALIVEEAGGIVTDVYGKALDFSKGRKLTENYGIVAASKSLHAKVLEAVIFILTKQ